MSEKCFHFPLLPKHDYEPLQFQYACTFEFELFFFQEPNITFFWQSNAIFDPFTPRETAENLHERGRPNYYDVTGNKKTVQPNCASPFFKL